MLFIGTVSGEVHLHALYQLMVIAALLADAWVAMAILIPHYLLSPRLTLLKPLFF